MVGRRPDEVAARQRQLEVELAQPVGDLDVAERRPGRERPERRVAHGDEGVGEHVGVHLDRPPGAVLLDLREQLGAQVGRRGIGVLEDLVHQRAERGPHGQVGHRRGDRRQGQVGHGSRGLVRERLQLGVVEVGRVVGLGQHPVGRARVRGARGGQRGVRRTAPVGVDAAVEGAHRQRREVALDRGGVDGAGAGELGLRATRGLPPAEDVDHLVVTHDGLLVVDHRVAGRAPEEHPVEGRRRRVVGGRAVPRDDLRLGARQGDVEQAQRLTGVLVTTGGAPPRRATCSARRRRGTARRRRRGRAARPRRAPTGPTGSGGRRSGTRGPCCRGSSPAGRLLRRSRAAGSARRRPRACRRRPGSRSQPSRPTTPNRSLTVTLCSASPMWRRSVRVRSPPTRPSTRATSPSSTALSSTAATPRAANTSARRRTCSLRASVGSSSDCELLRPSGRRSR